MWNEEIGRVKETQPGKFVRASTGAGVMVLAATLAFGVMTFPGHAGLVDGLDVDLDVDLGPAEVDVDVDVGRGGVDVGLDVGLDGGGKGVGPGNPTGPGGVIVDDDGLRRKARKSLAAGVMACAKDGNETAYNGFLIRDRDGLAFGWVHEATVSADGKLLAIRLQSSGNACYKLSNAQFRIRGDEIWTNADSVKFR